MSEEKHYPKKGDTLFKGDLDIHLNADISHWNKDLSGYAKGYKDAADFIVKGAIEGHSSYTFNVSFLVFPVVFLYRQYIELRLKEIILLGTKTNYEEHGLPKHHRIDELWRHARHYVERLSPKPETDALNIATYIMPHYCAILMAVSQPGGTAMRKLEIANPDVMRIAIQQEIARSDESRYDHRLHGLLLVTGGHSCQQVADLFGEDRRTVQRWVKRFETHGLQGMREGERPGRPATLDAKHWAALGRDLRRDPGAFGLTGHLWDGKLLSAHLRQRYGITLGVRQCQRIFGRLGFRLRKPSPQVAQSDPVKVAAFKKTAAPGKASGR